MANESKKQGASYEARFTAEALARGFDVMEPVGDYLVYDRIVVNKSDDTFRVQVKGTSYVQPGKVSYKVLAASGKGGVSKAKDGLREAHMDVLVAVPGRRSRRLAVHQDWMMGCRALLRN